MEVQYNENDNDNKNDNLSNVIRKQRSAVQLRPPTLRKRRISGPLVVSGMLAAQNNTNSSSSSSSSSSPPPPPSTTTITTTNDNNNNNTPTVSSSSSNQSLSPSLRPVPQPTQDYISAYRSSQIMLEYERSTSNTPLYDEHQEDYLTPIDSANCSILSVLAEAFVHQLGHQEIFTGEEAVNALHGLLALAYYPEYKSIQVANALLHCKPHVLFQPAEDYGLPPKSDVSFSSAWNKKYVLRYDSLEEETKPVGVLSNLTPCYVMGCEPGNTDCYAPRCPNNPSNAIREILHCDQSTSVSVVVKSLLHNHSQVNIDSSITLSGENSQYNDSQIHQEHYYRRQDSNNSNEERTIIHSLDEPARQNAILDLIRSHRSYCRTLDILHHVIIDSILSTNAIGTKEQRKTLVSNAFSTFDTLHKMNRDLYNDMKHLRISSQKEGKGTIDKIGDLFYSHIKLMSEPIITYLANIPLAGYIVDHERNTNTHFANLLERVKEDKRIVDSKITSLNYIYLAPRMQMPLYMTCLRGILAYTPQGHPDIDYLKHCIQKMERIERESKKLAKIDTERRVQVLRLADDLKISSSDIIIEEDLNLTAPQRRLLYHGALKKSSSNSITILLNKKTIHVFVLDHMVLTTTTTAISTTSSTKRNIRRDVHSFMEKIPLPMLHVQESKTNWVIKPSSASSISSNESTTRRRRISFLHSDSSQEDLGSTITLVHLGKKNHKPRVLSCSSMDEKKRCLKAIDEARKLYKQNNKHNDVFRLSWLNRTAFRVSRESSSSRNEDIISYDKVNCSVPLGNGITAVGTNTGIYRVHNDSSTADLMLPVGKVLQMATMSPKANLLLVLTAMHHELKAYTIESIIDATYDSRHGFIRGQSMSIDQSVQFFEVGSTQQHKDLLIYKKKRHNESVLVAVKPIEELYHAETRERFVLMSPQYFTNRHITSPHTYIFQRVHHENIRGKDVRMVQFCGAGNVALVCLNNFRFFSFDDGEPHEQRSSLSLDDRRRKDNDSLEARAAFYLTSSRILLCYNRYAYIIDAHHGHRIATGSHGQSYMFKWESEPLHVVRHKDYVIGVSNHFIEIRKIYSGELVQIMHADSCQLTYEGFVDNEHIIHGCMVESNTLDRQQLFQLVLHKT